MKAKNPIGIFDSGVGGTSIWKEIHQLLPNENTIFLADSKNAPYGNKPAQEIVSLSIKNSEVLLKMGCKIIVVACNTATTNAISVLRKSYNIPIIGIEPAIKPAALQTRSKCIGILATRGTLNSALFQKTSKENAKNTCIIEVIGEGLVKLIENGDLNSPEMMSLLEKYTAPMLEANVDYIVLGCSHFPYLIPQLQKILPKHIKIIDSGEAVARQTRAVLEKHSLLRGEESLPKLQFFTNSKTETLNMLLHEYSEKISVKKRDF